MSAVHLPMSQTVPMPFSPEPTIQPWAHAAHPLRSPEQEITQ